MRELSYIRKGEPILVRTVLKEHFGFSKGTVVKLKENKGIFVNGESVTVRKELKENDVLTVRLTEEKSENIIPVEMKLDIIYEDEDILAISKPSGMATHPSLNHYTDTLANGIMYYFKDNDFTFRAVNRLDLETSGIVLIAKNRNSAHKLSQQLKEGSIKKVYFALVVSEIIPPKGIIDKPIARKYESMILRHVSDDGKRALTEYETVSGCLLRVEPKTGRTHQIRVHLSFMGCPIVGDPLYGTKKESERLMLHCGEMTFFHPVTNEKMTVVSQLPDEFYEKNKNI